MARKIFVNYRRKDASASAGRLSDALERQFGRRNVFLDMSSIVPGLDFVDVIRDNVDACDAMVVVIGPNWLTSDGPQPNSARLHDPDDFVRIEIETAMRKGISIFPVLVEGAGPVHPDRIPSSIIALARYQALPISPDRFHDGVSDLIKFMKRSFDTERSNRRKELIGDYFSDPQAVLILMTILVLSLASTESTISGLASVGLPFPLALVVGVSAHLILILSILKGVSAAKDGQRLLQILLFLFASLYSIVIGGFSYVSFFDHIFTPELLRMRFGADAPPPALAFKSLMAGDKLACIAFAVSATFQLFIVMAGSMLIGKSPKSWRGRTARQFTLDERVDTPAVRGLKLLGRSMMRDRVGKTSISEGCLADDMDTAQAFEWLQAHGFASHDVYTKSTARIDPRGVRLMIDELSLIARYRSPIRNFFRSWWH
jgi:hypothetical protein